MINILLLPSFYVLRFDEGGSVNNHFSPLCDSLCLTGGNYDYVIPLEFSNHLIEDVEQKLDIKQELLGSYDKTSDPRKQSSAMRAREWFSKEDPKLIERLYGIYKADFVMMNYSNFSDSNFPLPLILRG